MNKFMDTLCIFEDMIVDSAKVKLDNASSSASVTLIDPQAPESKVLITGLPQNAIVIKVDKFKSPDAILSESRGARKRADYIVLAVKNSKKYILYVEMKSTTDSKEKIIQQLKGAVCFVGYCKEIAKEFWCLDKCLSGYESRFVSFTHTKTGSRKRPTRCPQNDELNDTPEKLRPVSYDQIRNFNSLI
jgi:hypothetical protein